LNPSTGEILVGSVETGLVTVRMKKAVSSAAVVLVSRREHREGKWPCVEAAPLTFVPMGSIAYRLARVAVGAASATATFEPRSEWDIAGGTALVRAAGGAVRCATTEIRFNQSIPRLDSVFAFSRWCEVSVPALLFHLGGQS
jgi:myo-inositol-1(or 4)-monophosphatase